MPRSHRINNAPAVAIFDADSPPSLAFTRSLGRQHINVRVYSHKICPVARLSRFCRDFAACPDIEDVDQFIPWLKQETASGRIKLVAPTSDLMAFYMAQFPEAFPAAQQQGMPQADAIFNMLFKDRFDACCKAHDVLTPLTLFPLSIAEALDQKDTLPYPVILKPKSHIGVGWIRGEVAHSKAELEKYYKPYQIDAKHQTLINQYPALQWPMLQAYVPNALNNLFSISGLLDAQSNVVAWCGSQKTSQWPPKLGIGIIFEAWQDNAAIKKGLDFAKHALKRGVFELEFIYDHTQQDYVAIDLNPRAHGHIAFDIARHHNLPLLWYRMSCGEPVPTQCDAADDIRWQHAIPYHLSQLIGVAKGPQRKQRLQTYIQQLQGKRVDIVNDWYDPMPSLGHAAYMFKNPGGLIKPFL